MSIGNASCVRSTIPGVHKVQGVWTGGGAATSCTHVATDWSRGIASLAYNAATGKYLLTFTDGGQQIVGHNIRVCGLTGVDPVTVNLLRGTYSTSAKTVQVEFSDLSGALIDLLATDKVLIDVDFTRAAP
jgi:hypothetical protein